MTSHADQSPQAKYEADVAQSRQRAGAFTTLSGQPVEPLYTPADLGEFDYGEKLGYPGQFPFTRGIHSTMYRGRLWTMRQFAGFGTAEDTNERFKFLVAKGQTGLSVAFDLPTLMGVDSDHPTALGEVGRCGVAIDSLADMERLFDGIDLAAASVSMTINLPANILFAFYLAVARRQGVPWDKLRGTLQNDILKEYHAQNEYVYPPEPSVKLIVDSMAFCARHVPQFNPISISGYHIREAGSSAGQELAFTLADGFHYVEQGIKAGLDVDDFAPRLSYFFNAHSDFFEEIAKFRAARRIWARELRDRYGARQDRSLLMRCHAQTAGCSLTEQQPMVNVVRTAFEALSAVLGGTQSLHTNSMDETISLPTEDAVTLALRTQQVIACETGVANTIDPLGGSYFVESLTDRIEAEAYDIFRRIDEAGGMIAAIEQGFFRRSIAETAYRLARQIDAGERQVIGVNAFVEDAPPIPVHRIDPTTEERQVARLAELKRTRDGAAVGASLAKLKSVAAADGNTIEPMIEAAEAYATVGEMVDALKQVYGEYRGARDW
ncbi:MAG: methylmalonyl-CoA mutase family protein [Phycisphaerae bacterium]|nr:methylmalonyl-CoA mutase family protein [Phycisphaerae bacterium]